jgi:hypothetical protein
LPDRATTQIEPVFRRELPFQTPFIAQTALRIDAKAIKFRRENCLILWLVWLNFLSVFESVEGKALPLSRVNIRAANLLTKFILDGGFQLRKTDLA